MKREERKLKIYISTFNRKVINVKYGVPIEVGAALRNDFIYELKDNVGDNISSENKYYGELTGVYWVWKNQKFEDDDIIGFCHWNKKLQISYKEIITFFNQNKNNAWIALEPTTIVKHSVKKEIEVLEKILKTDYPDYYLNWTKQYDSHGEAHDNVCMGGSMFITRYSDFRLYCEWLFDVLFKLRKQIGNSVENKYKARYCAYMAERLLSVYLATNKSIVKSVPMGYKRWWIPFCKKCVKILHLNKSSALYRNITTLIGYKSSYKN